MNRPASVAERDAHGEYWIASIMESPVMKRECKKHARKARRRQGDKICREAMKHHAAKRHVN